MSAADSPKPRCGWALVVNALAELGQKELERRERAAQHDDETARDEATPAQLDHGDETRPNEAAA